MQFYTSANIPTDLSQRSFAAGIARIMPNGMAPLFALSGYAKKKVAKQIEHGFWTKTAVFPSVTVNGSHGTGVTTLTVDDSAQVVVGNLLRYQAAYGGTHTTHATLAENLLVTAVNSSTEIVVTRGYAGTTAQTIADNAVLISIGTAFEQGSNAPTSLSIVPSRTLNYTQIFRNAWDITGTLAAIQMEMGYNSVSENRADCASFHAQDIEKAAMFGVKSTGSTLNGRPIFTMDGIEKRIYDAAPSQLHEMGATTTYTQLETVLDPVFDQMTDSMNGQHRVLLVGGTARRVINNIGRLSGTYQLTDGQTGFGLQFSTFKIARGTFTMIEHPMLNSHTDWKKMAICLDLSSFDFAYLEGRDTFHTDINTKGMATNGRDAIGGVLTSELTTELVNPFACAMLYNFTAAAA